MTKRSSPGATAWSLLLAFLGAIVAVYVVTVVDETIQAPYYSGLLRFVVFPLIGAIFVVPICLILTLLAWACFVLAHRWVHNSPVWAGVIAVALTIVSCSAFCLIVVLILPTLREQRTFLEFFVALAVVLAVCVARGVGRQRKVAENPARFTLPQS